MRPGLFAPPAPAGFSPSPSGSGQGGGTDRAQSLHFKPGTWFTMANSTATEGLPMPWVESNIIDQGDTYKERPSTILDNSLCQEG